MNRNERRKVKALAKKTNVSKRVKVTCVQRSSQSPSSRFP
jgi:hypothetical protein